MAEQHVLQGARSAEAILVELRDHHYYSPPAKVLDAALSALSSLNAELKCAAAGAAFIGTNEHAQVVMQFPTLMQFVILSPDQARLWGQALLRQAALAENPHGDTLHSGDDPHVDRLTSIHAALDEIESETAKTASYQFRPSINSVMGDLEAVTEAVRDARSDLELFEAHYMELRGFVTQAGVALRDEASPAAPEGSDHGREKPEDAT